MTIKNSVLGSIDTGGGNLQMGDITTYIDGLGYLHSDYKAQINELKELLYSFRPKTALELLGKLENRINDSNITISENFKSSLLFLKALCKSDIISYDTKDSAKDFISAYNLNKNDPKLRERACLEYLNLNEIEKAKTLVNDILSDDEFNYIAWFVKLILSNELKKDLIELPNVLKLDNDFQLNLIHQLYRIGTINSLEQINELEIKYSLTFDNKVPVNYNNRNKFITLIDLHLLFLHFDNPNNYIIGQKIEFTNDRYLKKAITLLKKYNSTLENTELNDSLFHCQFCLYYLLYVKKPKKDYLDKILKTYDNLDQKWQYLKLLCQVLNHRQQYNLAYSKMIDYKKNSINIESEFFLFETTVLNMIDKKELILQSLNKYLEITSLIGFKELFNIANVFFNAFFEQDIIAKEEVFNKIFSKDFKENYLKNIFFILGKVFFIKEYDHLDILNKLNVLSCDRTIDNKHIKYLIANSFKEIGAITESINYLKTSIDVENSIPSLELYISLLYEDLFNKETNYADRSLEILDLLHNLNNKERYFNIHFMNIEACLYFLIQDYNTSFKIQKRIIQEYPDNEEYISNFIKVLLRLEKEDKVVKYIEKRTMVFNNKSIELDIASTLIKIDQLKEKSFEIIYNQAKDSSNEKARQLFLQNSILFENSFFTTFEDVQVGRWVSYSNKDDRFWKKIDSNDIEFIGRNKEDIITITNRLTHKKEKYHINEIVNDKLKLLRDLHNEVKNPINNLGMQSFNLSTEEDKILDNFIDLFKKPHEDQLNNQRKFLNDYNKYECSFLKLVINSFDDDFIDGYFYLVNRNEFNHNILMLSKNSDILDSTNVKYYLDYSSIFFFYQLSLDNTIKIKYEHKFHISALLFELIKQKIKKIKKEPKSEFSISIREEQLVRHDYDINSKNRDVEYLEGILMWIKENCEIVFIKEKLDYLFKVEVNDNNFFEMFIENQCITRNDNSILITSDLLIYYEYSNIEEQFDNIITPDIFIKELYNKNYDYDFFRFLLKHNYRGFNMDVAYLKFEINEMLLDNENSYDKAIENLSYTFNASNTYEVGIDFYHYLISLDSNEKLLEKVLSICTTDMNTISKRDFYKMIDF